MRRAGLGKRGGAGPGPVRARGGGGVRGCGRGGRAVAGLGGFGGKGRRLCLSFWPGWTCGAALGIVFHQRIIGFGVEVTLKTI